MPSSSPTATAQGAEWAALNKTAMENISAIPTRFGKQQDLVHFKVGDAYLWAPSGSWPYANVFAQQ